ncbi:MAG: hypothetical protein HC923_13350 [Myxococcales bacterium]|nr:hypothetical protein [Myxococcales bacterium]
MISVLVDLEWLGDAFHERWARVIDGPHSMIDVAWQYDEFLWLEVATRYLLVVADDEYVVGRTLSRPRCRSAVDLFNELDVGTCSRLNSINSPHRYQPFAWTRFSLDGARLRHGDPRSGWPRRVLDLDIDFKDEQLVVVGTAVRVDETGQPPYYFEPPDATSGTLYSPYDGYLAVLDRRDGAVDFERFVDRGRADLLASVRWTDQGILGAGATDWNRWSGGMSVSRGPCRSSFIHPRTVPRSCLARSSTKVRGRGTPTCSTWRSCEARSTP